MARHRIRADGRRLAQLLTDCGVDLEQCPPGDDGWHDEESLAAVIVAALTRPRPPVSAAAPMMTPRQAFESGRITARSARDWEARFATDPQGVGAVLASLSPVLADDARGPAAAAASVEPSLLEQIDDELFGRGHNEASRARLYAEQDAAAEASYRAIVEADRAAAAEALTEAEYNAIFGGPAD